MLIPWHSKRYHGCLSVYTTCFWYFKICFCKFCNEIPLYPNLQLMTTIVYIIMTTLNNTLAKPELEVANWFTQIVIYAIQTMQALCYEHWTEVLHSSRSCIACKLGNGATNGGPTIDIKSQHSEMKPQPTYVKTQLLLDISVFP